MEKKKPAQVFHFDLYGKREDKYDFLSNNAMKTIAWQTLQPQEPELFFVPKDFRLQSEYDNGFSVNNLFPISSVSIATSRDGFVVSMDKNELIKKVNTFCDVSKSDSEIYTELELKDNRDWKLPTKRKSIISDNKRLEKINIIDYRVFDTRNIFYHKDAIDFGRENVMKNMLKENIGLITNRQCRTDNFHHLFISKNITDLHIMETANACPNHFPLYLYPETSTQQTTLSEFETLTGLNGRVPNLNMEIVNEMAKGLGIPFVAEKTNAVGFSSPTEFKTLSDFSAPKEFSPIDILDYIYAVLHSPSYRSTYKEFLKIDFPRVPYPHHVGTGRNVRTGRDLSVLEIQKYFWQLVALGGALRQIHLLESEVVDKLITQYPEDGDNVVVKPIYKEGNVFINETQYFANVPEVAWNFYIGGYQPAQKWLKDRKDRELSYDDILHYQKIIVALTETDKLMKEIDKITL